MRSPHHPVHHGPRAEESEADLVETIRHEVIPRLIAAHVSAVDVSECPVLRPTPTATEIAEFARLAVAQEMTTMLERLESMSKGGLGLPTLILELIAPSAALLGDLWLDDELSFSEVTLGSNALHRLIAVLQHEVELPHQHRGLVILSTPSSEQHTLGIQFLAALLAESGFGASVEAHLDRSELCERVAEAPVEVVALSTSADKLVGEVLATAKAARAASMNTDLRVVLGGHPELARGAGADGLHYCASLEEARDRVESWSAPPGEAPRLASPNAASPVAEGSENG